MKNLFKFVLFVVLLSAGISALYDYRLKHGNLSPAAEVRPEKYTLASAPSIDPKNIATLDSLNRERRALVASILPSVVSVKTSKKVALRRTLTMEDFFFRNPRQFRNPGDEALVQNSLGSGVIVSAEGHIITNNHVVDQVDEIEVQLSDGTTKKARLVGADAEVDLAVLKIDDPGVKALKFGDSDAVQPGDFVLAIGNPFGFEETVTDGIISSKGRPNRMDGFGDYLQTNAAINPGNSGGPLVNLSGEIIGINTAIISQSGGSQGIGFAIPSNTVKTALESLLKQGHIVHGYLGVTSSTSPQQTQRTDGVVVDDVAAGSPAAQAQMRPGDVIKKFNGRDVHSIAELRNVVGQTELNKKVDVEIERQGKRITVATELKERPADYQTAGVMPRPQNPPAGADDDDDQDASGLASVKVAELTPDLRQHLDVPSAVRGVVVTDVPDDAGELRKGDVIEEINQQPVTSVADFKKALSSVDPEKPQVLSVCRHRTRSFVVLRPQ